jgi:hypothetical protein
MERFREFLLFLSENQEVRKTGSLGATKQASIAGDQEQDVKEHIKKNLF